MEKDVKIYTLPTCPHCNTAKEYFAKKGITYQEFNVGKDQKAANEMITVYNSRSVPVIVIGTEVILGFDAARIDTALNS